MDYNILRDLAIIVVMAKLCGICARKCKIPQVAGEIIAGLLIGPSILGWVQPTDFLSQMAEIGVILLMFSAGLESDLHELVETGPKAFAIACGIERIFAANCTGFAPKTSGMPPKSSFPPPVIRTSPPESAGLYRKGETTIFVPSVAANLVSHDASFSIWPVWLPDEPATTKPFRIPVAPNKRVNATF